MKIDLRELAKYDKIAIATHTRPDGDALGSSVGLYYGFLTLGKEVDLLCDCDVPQKVRFLYGMDKFKKVAGSYDLIILSDCNEFSRTGDLVFDFKNVKKTVCIDHHQTMRKECDINIIDAKSASCSEIVLEILDENNIEITSEVANCLYTGLMTDSGNFCHTNVTEKTFLHAAELFKLGADPNLLTRKIFKLLEGNKVKLLAKAMSDLKFFDNGKIAYFFVSKKTLSELECESVQTEGLIDNALSVENVQIAIAVMEGNKPNEYKISLRSIKGVEVSRVAESFGGGGHKQAAGCTLCGNYYDVEERIVNMAAKYTE